MAPGPSIFSLALATPGAPLPNPLSNNADLSGSYLFLSFSRVDRPAQSDPDPGLGPAGSAANQSPHGAPAWLMRERHDRQGRDRLASHTEEHALRVDVLGSACAYRRGPALSLAWRSQLAMWVIPTARRGLASGASYIYSTPAVGVQKSRFALS